MKSFVLVIAAALVLTAGAASAQVPLAPASKAPIAGILTWTPEQQASGYRDIEHIFRTHTIRRGTKVHPLPMAARRIDPTFSYQGKTWTVDDYMAAYRVSGLLVLKDGRIVLEKYGLGRKATDRWTSFSVAKSVTSTLVGAAIQDGSIKSINDPITAYVPDLKGSEIGRASCRERVLVAV